MARAFDHLVIAAETLAEGRAALTDLLGCPPEPGGKHGLMGTHNLLWRLGPQDYLELIAIDPEAETPPHPRWFGLDQFRGPPRLVCWAMRQSPLTAPAGSRVVAASRGDLHWRVAIPDTGVTGNGGLAPLRIDWGDSLHPAAQLPDRGLRLMALDLSHPQPMTLLLDDPRINIARGPVRLAARLQTCRGEVTL